MREETTISVASLVRRNLRDLGGLPTRKPGVVVKRGHLFRSSALSAFEPDEQRALVSLKISRAIDLRTRAEVTQAGTAVVSTEFRVIHSPLFENPRSNWIAPPDQSPQATASRYFEMLQDGLGTFHTIVTELVQPNAAPVVICCSAGRDRTGIVVACLLDLLGVPDEAIATDYAQSDSFHPESGRAHAATIHELLTLVRHRHRSVRDMLVAGGLARTTVEALRRELLTG